MSIAQSLGARKAGRLGDDWPSVALLDRIEHRAGGFLVIFAVIVAALSVGFRFAYDFSIYWAAGADVASGQSAYAHTLAVGAEQIGATQIYVYPPPLAHLLAPLTAVLPTWGGYAIFESISIAALAVMVRRHAPAARRWPKLVLSFGALWVSLFLGQVNLLVAAGLIAILADRDDRVAGPGSGVR